MPGKSSKKSAKVAGKAAAARRNAKSADLPNAAAPSEVAAARQVAKPRKGARSRESAPSSPAFAARQRAQPVLLSGGNPQIAKADGDAPVQAYIAAMPGWKRDVGRRLDALIERAVPTALGLRKAVKWNSPFYGVAERVDGRVDGGVEARIDARVDGGSDGGGWFLSLHCFAKYVKVAFFRGTSLRPMPPGESKQKEVRYLDIHEGDLLDEAQFADWVKQASALPGERM